VSVVKELEELVIQQLSNKETKMRVDEPLQNVLNDYKKQQH